MLRSTGFLDTKLNITCNNQWNRENEGKVHRVLGHKAELNLQLSMNVGKMRKRCTGFLDTKLHSTCNSQWMLGKWGKGAPGSWTHSWTQPATLDESWENEGQVHRVPGHTAEHNPQHLMKVGNTHTHYLPTHTHMYMHTHTHTLSSSEYTHTHTHISIQTHIHAYTHTLSSSSTHILLLVFLLLLLVHPQAPLPVQVLDDASSQSDVVASHGLVHRQAVDRPHPLLQLAVQRRSQLTVPQLRQNKGGHQLMQRTLLLWKLVTHIVTVTRWSSPCNCLLLKVVIHLATVQCYYWKCPPTLLLFKVPTHLATVQSAHSPC